MLDRGDRRLNQLPPRADIWSNLSNDLKKPG
jgi:hypothetical protein